MYAPFLLWATAPGLLTWAKRQQRDPWLAWAVILTIAAVCALQPDAYNKDREVYRSLIEVAADGNFYVMEPVFVVLARALAVIGLSGELLAAVFFFVVAIASLKIKYELFKEYGGAMFGCVAVFFGYYFLLHEWTQIRIGLGIGLLYFSWIHGSAKRWQKFWFYGIAATMCHYSCLLFLAGPLVVSRRHAHKLYGALLFTIFVKIASMVGGTSLASVLFALGFEKLTIYADLLSEGLFDQISPVRLAPHLLLTAIGLITRSRWGGDGLATLFFQLHFFGSVLFLALWAVPVAAYRLSDIFLFAGILFCGRLAHLLRRDLYRAIVVAYSGAFLIYTAGFSGLLTASA